uniref:Uncharacterized protein n=1 Tax=Panagrolaimus davidi TaxID=227884 RepID=A0A914PXS5_9BILA
MQFKASQRLLRSENTQPKTVRIPTTAVAGSFPARMPISSNHSGNANINPVRMPNLFVQHNLGLDQGHRQQQHRGLQSAPSNNFPKNLFELLETETPRFLCLMKIFTQERQE